MLGGIQPEPIQQVAQQATNDGLLQRFMFDVPSTSGGGQDRAPDDAALTRYRDLIPALAALHPGQRSGDVTDRHVAVVLHGDAHVIREDIDTLAATLAALPDTSPQLRSTFAKWHGLFARLCLTFHLIEIADARARGEIGPPVTVISLELHAVCRASCAVCWRPTRCALMP